MIKLLPVQQEHLDKEVLECKHLTNDMIFMKYHVVEGDIIRVNKQQFVCMIEKGKVLDMKEEEGEYIIEEAKQIDEEFDKEWENVMIRKSEEEALCVLFLNQNKITHNRYFIQDPIKYKNWRNGEYSDIYIVLEGYYDFKIDNPKKMLSKVIGLRNCFTKQELIEKIRRYIICSIEKGINEISEEYKLDIDTLASNSEKLEMKLKQNEYDLKLLENGVKLTYFDITKFEVVKKKFKFF